MGIRRGNRWVRFGEPYLCGEIISEGISTGGGGDKFVIKVEERSSLRTEVRTNGANVIPLMYITTMEILFKVLSNEEFVYLFGPIS